MTAASPVSPRLPDSVGSSLPSVRLDVRAGGVVTSYNVSETGFLLGSVPGCDLRLPGTSQPPVLAIISRQADGVRLRKLAPIGVLFLNEEAVAEGTLRDGDRLVVGGIEIGVHVTAPAVASVPVMRVKLFDEASEERETVLREREQSLDEERAALAAERHEASKRAVQMEEQQQELNRLRNEMGTIRQQLVDRYRHKRDRLAGMQESVRKAGKRLQEEKRRLEIEKEQARALAEGSYAAEMRNLAGQMNEKSHALLEQEEGLRQQIERFEAERQRLQNEMSGREKKLDEEKQVLTRSQSQHQIDLVRLDRLAASLEQRQRQMQRTALDIDKRYETLQRDTRELEEQASKLDEWEARLKQREEDLGGLKLEIDAGRAEQAARSAALEGQQAMLTTLRSRLERMREEYRKEEQQLSERRSKQDEAEEEIVQRLSDARRLSHELEAEKLLHDQQQKQFEERRVTVESAVQQLRQAQEKLTREVELLDARKRELESYAEQQREQEALLTARLLEVDEEKKRLRADRQAVEERQSNLTRAEQVLTLLQEQIRKRADELATRQKALDDQGRLDLAARELAETRRAELEQYHQEKDAQYAALTFTIDKERGELAVLKTDLEAREEALKNEVRELVETKQLLETTRQQFEVDQARARAEAEAARQETETARSETAALVQQMPDLQRQADEALQRLSLAREQLRGHLAEIHEYVRQGRGDLEALRDSVATEQQRLRGQEQSLHEAQDAHRLAVAAFRQQLSEWQGQLAELKLSFAQGETRLEQRVAEVEEQAQQIAVTSQQLAQQAEALEQQERQVVERRQEVDRHLGDMREWYRKKIRELARVETDAELPEDIAAKGNETTTLSDIRPTLLNLTSEVEPGDRQLGELMRSLELIDADTLTALLVEARRKRRSLRQLLLQGGYLTLFQMALIETGNLDALVLGPVRVIDRLHATPHEAAYRVFDPRHDREALLRHLAESEMDDAVRPDEFRQRFSAAASVSHANLATTWEVIEIAERPAVLQEWLTGLPASDWPALAAVPGVCYRLLTQAALGLQAAHQAGLSHGRLHAGSLIVTPEGMLKVCGLGEPSWLSGEEAEVDDLIALGRCAQAWSIPTGEKKGSKAKPLPDSLQNLLKRLCGEEGPPFANFAEVLEELDTVGRTIPANAAAWERFVRHVRDESADTPLRRSA